ncbi:MAG: recombinase RecT [Rhodoferax sp.]|nr:recombinase RecT [Rhodoferax sp.]
MSNELRTNQTLSPVAAFSKTLDRMKSQIALALPKHMSADRMARLALTAFSTSKALQNCKTDSILASLMTATQLGLEPGINGQGYLIPYKDTCTFVPGWKGLVDLVSRAGRATVWTGAVYEGDKFDYQLGDEPFCRHKPGDSEGNFTHVYAIGRVKDAQMPVIEVWTRGKVKKHLTQYNKVGTRHYALASESNFEMYARKVALLQVLKYMPSSIELANAITVSHAAEAGQGAVIEGDFVTINTEAVDQETGEIIRQEEKALPVCTSEKFDAKKSEWKSIVEGGKKSVNDLIKFIETKDLLSTDQKMEIASWEIQGENE